MILLLIIMVDFRLCLEIYISVGKCIVLNVKWIFGDVLNFFDVVKFFLYWCIICVNDFVCIVFGNWSFVIWLCFIFIFVEDDYFD